MDEFKTYKLLKLQHIATRNAAIAQLSKTFDYWEKEPVGKMIELIRGIGFDDCKIDFE